ncbi:putative serine/threonine-protein kinase [Colletotrichum chlorophyti]|uniref:Putative serine/threonine-protein kinase n=1 Tax=Colletotrichum chlorophyti TaxID=708187 RepID=A0A1Q8S277_9PEZI|nr:putative serine/threonine-protein kinase [Colletotrichum chlorophyti]
MAQASDSHAELPSSSSVPPTSFLRKLFGRNNAPPAPIGPAQAKEAESEAETEPDSDDPQRLMRRVSRKVVPGLPRVQTFKRQQSERRNNLAPVQPSPAERRALSVDRRVQTSRTPSQAQSFPRASAPDFFGNAFEVQSTSSTPASPIDEKTDASLNQVVPQAGPTADEPHVHDVQSNSDARSVTTSHSQFEAMIHNELESTWILNLSMHFRDKSKREKFFVTYRETATLWRRVTISLDYRNAPDNSLEMDLLHTKSQRDKSSKIYEAIRDSLQDIQFYPSVTNLKLQTTDGRLHVHVVEDVNEIIHYPTVRQVQHLGCRRIKEKDIDFDSHMSGFVYKVRVGGEVLIKKEIPGPDTIDEFLYEINALNRLRYSRNIIRFHGVVVDDDDEHVKGLLISYAVHGALIDVIYDNRQDSDEGLPWSVREKWARQIVQGLADIHESGFVQGDFTLSNIVIDYNNDAKIIDINRRGCPVGWEPPEATPLIESNQRISMYIGVKSDLYQLGMVLWALASQDDEPEAQGRPLQLGEECRVPAWYRHIVEICLSEDPRLRLQASSLMALFPDAANGDDIAPPSISVDDGYTMREYFVDNYHGNGARIRTVQPTSDWSYVNMGHTYVDPTGSFSQDPYQYTRGRSPPSPLPSQYGHCDSPTMDRARSSWADARFIAPSYSDIGVDDIEQPKSATPTTKDSISTTESPNDTNEELRLKSKQLRSTPLSGDLAVVNRMEDEPTLGQEESNVAGEEFANLLSREQRAEPSKHVDPIETRPMMATPMTIKHVGVDENDARVGEETLERSQENDIPGQSEPNETGSTEPEDQTDRTLGLGETADVATPSQAMEREDLAADKPSAIEANIAAERMTMPATATTELSAEGSLIFGSTKQNAQPSAAPGRLLRGTTAEAPDLKGVGGALMDTDEQAMREKVSLNDDFTSMAAAATNMTTETQV